MERPITVENSSEEDENSSAESFSAHKIEMKEIKTIVQNIEDSKKETTITFKIESKTIRLPTNTVTLKVYVSTESLLVAGILPEDLNYNWTLISIDGGNGTSKESVVIKDDDKQQLIISKLEEGKYSFKVSITGPQGINVTSIVWVIVLPGNQ